MIKVDFYTLPQSDEDARLAVACRLTEKAYSLGHHVYIHAGSQTAAEEIDNLLWEFRPDSFIPHAIDGLMDDEEVPVLIGYNDDYAGPKDVLINLSPHIPPFHDQFRRISEIVSGNDNVRQAGREHWKHYKASGFELQHHQL